MNSEISRRILRLATTVVGISAFGLSDVQTTNLNVDLVHHTAEATPNREIPNAEQLHAAITNEAFLTQTREPRSLFTRQTDPAEYLDPHFTNNACGQAAIATILKLYAFFESGTVPDITIQTVRDYLKSQTYLGAQTQQPFMEWDTSMYLSSVKAALDLYATDFPIQTLNFTGVPLTGYEVDRRVQPQLMTNSQLDTLVTEAQDIFAKGGLVVVFSTTYNGHLFLLSDVYRTEAHELRGFVIDSFGPTPTREGLIGDQSVLSFVGEWNGQLGLISAFGVYPTYTQFRDTQIS